MKRKPSDYNDSDWVRYWIFGINWMMMSSLRCLLVSVYPGDGAISVARLLFQHSFRGTASLSGKQNSDSRASASGKNPMDACTCHVMCLTAAFLVTPQARLHGPASPNKITFYTLNRSTHFK